MCEPFADSAAQVCSPIHTYAHLVCEWFANHLVRMCVPGFNRCSTFIFREPEANKGHPTHPMLFVFAQKTNKFRFAVNRVRTVCGQRSAGLQSHPHIRAFGLRVVYEPFGSYVCTRALTVAQLLVSCQSTKPLRNQLGMSSSLPELLAVPSNCNHLVINFLSLINVIHSL